MTLVVALSPAVDHRVGDEKWFVGAFPVNGEFVVKPGYLADNGALVLIASYPKLFAEIGHAYNPAGPGVDPGGGSFYLPDRTNGFSFIPRGSTRFPTRGVRGGSRLVKLPDDGSQDPNHTHTYPNTYGSFPSSGVGPKIGAEPGSGLGANTAYTSGAVGGRSGSPSLFHQNQPPCRVVGGWIIRFV